MVWCSSGGACDFYPRSPCGERHGPILTIIYLTLFLSTLSLRRATVWIPLDDGSLFISIHALLAESDVDGSGKRATSKISIHALLAESDQVSANATHVSSFISIHALLAESDANMGRNSKMDINFYPRSPCGERRAPPRSKTSASLFLSTLSLRRATNYEAEQAGHKVISIHALLAESDDYARFGVLVGVAFLSTLSLRRATVLPKNHRPSVHDFYPRSPCGERLQAPPLFYDNNDFYPRSPCGERPSVCSSIRAPGHFYPRSPCGERRQEQRHYQHCLPISIHALLAESDIVPKGQRSVQLQFLSTLSLRRATLTAACIFLSMPFLSTLSLRRATCGHCGRVCAAVISIHALLAESD